jgi:hypothetical protein
MAVTFFHQLIFDTPQLVQFVSRTPKFEVHDEARMLFSDSGVWVTLPQTFDGRLNFGISCRQSDWQLSSIAQVCGSSLPQALIPAGERLYILEDSEFSPRNWKEHQEKPKLLTENSLQTIYR